MELTYPLALASPSSSRLSNTLPPLERLYGRYTTSQPYLPIVSHTGFAIWHAVPSLPLLPHLETNTPETPTVSLQSNETQTLCAVGVRAACFSPRAHYKHVQLLSSRSEPYNGHKLHLVRDACDNCLDTSVNPCYVCRPIIALCAYSVNIQALFLLGLQKPLG